MFLWPWQNASGVAHQASTMADSVAHQALAGIDSVAGTHMNSPGAEQSENPIAQASTEQGEDRIKCFDVEEAHRSRRRR